MPKTLYDILQVSPTALDPVIKSAYRALAALHHPDTGSAKNDELFKAITRAHSILADPETRAKYDARLLHGEENAFLGLDTSESDRRTETVKKMDGTDTWCTIEEHIRRKGSELASANLEGLCLRDLSLDTANLSGANLSNALIEGVSLEQSNLSNIVCRHTTFKNVSFTHANCEGACFENCTFHGCTFKHCTIINAALRSSDLRGSSFEAITFQSVDCSDSIFENVVFSGRQYRSLMENINFSRCNLQHACFGRHHAKTEDKTILYYSMPPTLKHCDFRGANLADSVCEEARFHHCNFSDASLASANMKGSTITRPQSFENASLFGADFTAAILTEVDLSSCNVINARFHNTTRKDVTFPNGFKPPSIIETQSPSIETQLPSIETEWQISDSRALLIVIAIVIVAVVLIALGLGL